MASELHELASNYRWTWSLQTQALFRALGWDGGPPLAAVEAAAPDAVAAHQADIAACHGPLADELAAAPERRIAYLSMEFGISETLPIYSGGLGILAGDHLKTASDLGLGLVAVGLLYSEGFFHQEVDAAGQHERYERVRPAELGIVDTGARVKVEVAGETIQVVVRRADVGSVPLLLLDAPPVTDRLYAGGPEHRLRQELILGVGGARALAALGIEPSLYHLNEGHAAFVTLELLAAHLRQGASLEEALRAVRPHTLFTTHTPVPAGIDRFPLPLFERYLGRWALENGVAVEDLIALGELPDDPGPASDMPDFNMAAYALRVSGPANGVSQLHGQVSRAMFSAVQRDRPIESVTNGVHARTWVAPEWQNAFDARLGTGWDRGSAVAWDAADQIDDQLAATTRRNGRARLAAVAGLDPDALTIGFARRFATYKRSALLLQRPERLESLLRSADQPVQFVFAGKAHPADDAGKAVLQAILDYADQPVAAQRFVFLSDYDMALARLLYAGCDVWLNTPVRPHEASGTSGMKAALNGALNCSISDGWWDEWYDGSNGWVIPSSDLTDADERDLADSDAVHDLLEHAIVPAFYGSGWWSMVRHAWRTLGPHVTAARMVGEYDSRYYQEATS